MHDKELYQQILGLEAPWVVESVDLDNEKKEIVVFRPSWKWRWTAS